MKKLTPLALLLLAILVCSETLAQKLPPKAVIPSPRQPDEVDIDCVIMIPTIGYDHSDESSHRQSSEDVLRVRRTLVAALLNSADMRAKVNDACREINQGVRPHPSLKPVLTLNVVRDSPGVDLGVAHPKTAGRPGSVTVDLGDVDRLKDHFDEDSDAGLVDVITKSYLTRLLAHEFDHLRDPPDRGKWGKHHGDPGWPAARVQTGAPVDDANKVKEEVGSGDVRIHYGGDEIGFSGGERRPGESATLKLLDLINSSRTVKAPNGGSGFGPPIRDESARARLNELPHRPCAEITHAGCYPRAIQYDQDLDGITDELDNCPQDVNPWQLDRNENGIGDDCEVKR